jgi:hypothetical protein
MSRETKPLVHSQQFGRGGFRAALVRELQRGDNSKGRTLERIARRLIAMAESGDIAAIKEVMNRMDGAVPTHAPDATGTHIGQLVIQWRDPQQLIAGDTVKHPDASLTIDHVQAVPASHDPGTQ